MATVVMERPNSSNSGNALRRPSRTRGLTVRVSVDGDGTVTIAAGGKLDIYTAARLRRRMDQHDPGVEPVVIDISRVSLVDSTGLGTLLSYANRARRGGMRLGLVCGPEFAALLAITRMVDAFDLTPVDEVG